MTLAQKGGNVDATVYVRFLPTIAQVYSGKITNSSAGAPTANVAVTGTGVLGIITPPGKPTVTVNPLWLNFGDVPAGKSDIKQYTVTGRNLIANINVSAETGYSISTSLTGTYSTSITLAKGTGNVDQIIYVKFSPVANIRYSSLISNASSGAITQIVDVSGFGAIGNLSVSPKYLEFGNVRIGLPLVKSYTVTGTNLSSNVVITAPDEYTISTSSSSNYLKSITLLLSGASVNSVIYVKFTPKGQGENVKTITNASAFVTPKDVFVTGTGIQGTITVNPTSLAWGSVPIGRSSSMGIYTVRGTDLVDNITVTTTPGFAISQHPLDKFSNTLTLYQVSGNVYEEIYVLFMPTMAAKYSSAILHSSMYVPTSRLAVSGTGANRLFENK